MGVRDLSVLFDVRDVKGWVANGLDIDKARLVVDGGLYGGKIV